jgi:hypothetical protein
MKKVFSNSEICHVYAQQTQNEGRTSANNIFFYENKIYSYGYHYKLAEIIENNTIIINNTGYSNSTAKHINLITNATRQYTQYFYNDICLNNVYDSILSASKSIIKARLKERYANLIISKFENFINFANEFNKVVKSNNHTQDSFLTLIELKQNEQFQEIQKIYNEIAKDKDKFIEAGKERERKEKERKQREFNESLEKFFNYEINYITLKTDEDFLRISQDKTQIETTQGVKIPIQEAKKLYELIQLEVEIKGYRISNYTVISINGTLKIGCHKINVKNVHEIGQKLINNF